MKPDTVSKRADELLKNGGIRGRLDTLQKELKEGHFSPFFIICFISCFINTKDTYSN